MNNKTNLNHVILNTINLNGNYILSSEIGVTVAKLVDGKVPPEELPSYVDDVIEGYYFNGKFYKDEAHTQEITGEAHKIYVDMAKDSQGKQNHDCYRWSGTAYIKISTMALVTETSDGMMDHLDKIKLNKYPTNAGSRNQVLISDSEGHIIWGSNIPRRAFKDSWQHTQTDVSIGTVLHNIAIDRTSEGEPSTNPETYPGTVWYGGIQCSGIPSVLSNCECSVQIFESTLPGTDIEKKVMHIDLYSVTTAPYHWTAVYYEKTRTLTPWSTSSDGIQNVLVDGSTLQIIDGSVNITGKQNTLISGTNIKTVNNTSLLGSGNLSITANNKFKDTWKHKGGYTLSDMFFAIVDDSATIYGSSWADGIRCTDLAEKTGASGLSNCECVVQILESQASGSSYRTKKVIVFGLYSSSHNPYNWNGIFYNGTLQIAKTGETNVINTVQVDGTALPITNKTVNITGKFNSSHAGDLTTLTTTSKDTLVAAINEVDAEVATKQDTLVSGTNIRTVNGNSLLGSSDLSLKTFSDVPSELDAYKNGTTDQFCEKFEQLVNPQGGTGFLTGDIKFTDLPSDLTGGRCEMIIYVPTPGVYVLETSSTDSFQGYGTGTPGRWTAMWCGSLLMGWQGFMTCPQASVPGESDYKYIPVNDSDGVSKYWLDKSLETKENTSNKSTSVASSSTDDQYPSAKATYDFVMNNAMTVLSKTYAELKTLIDNSQLSPGRYYRITDYACTTTTTNTSVANPIHQFDILVQALNTNKLSNNALATWHDGDTYFSSSRLDCWQLKYSFANDTNLFQWADSVNGKGVIYYMKDEYGNEAPYDFKNILFEKDGLKSYTFSSVDGKTDLSLTGDHHNNIIGELVADGQHRLNFNRFIGVGCFYNVIPEGGNNNTFGSNCESNKFGLMCSNNTFGSYCHHNTFGNNCYRFTVGQDFRYANVGNDSHDITFVDADGNLLTYVYNVEIGEAVHWIKFIGTNTGAGSGNKLQNLNIAMGIEGTGQYTPLVITLAVPRNAKYTWNVAYDSSNNIKQWCDANDELVTNKVTTITSASTNTQYPSAKAVYDYTQTLTEAEIDAICDELLV